MAVNFSEEQTRLHNKLLTDISDRLDLKTEEYEAFRLQITQHLGGDGVLGRCHNLLEIFKQLTKRNRLGVMKYDVLKDAFGVSNNQDIVGLIEEREEEIRIAADVPQNKRQGQSEVDGQPKGQGQSEVDGQPKGQGQSEVDGQPKDSFLDSSPTDVEIAKMSSMIGSEWHQLGIYLGLTTAGLAQIRMNNQESADMIFKMLMKWRIKNPIDGTFRTLKSALKNAGSDWDTILTTLKRERTTDTTN